MLPRHHRDDWVQKPLICLRVLWRQSHLCAFHNSPSLQSLQKLELVSYKVSLLQQSFRVQKQNEKNCGKNPQSHKTVSFVWFIFVFVKVFLCFKKKKEPKTIINLIGTLDLFDRFEFNSCWFCEYNKMLLSYGQWALRNWNQTTIREVRSLFGTELEPNSSIKTFSQ